MEKKICGVRTANFTGRDGTVIEDFPVSFSSPISSDAGKGIEAESHYITKAKLDNWGIDIMAAVNRNADVFLSRTSTGKTTVVGLSVRN